MILNLHAVIEYVALCNAVAFDDIYSETKVGTYAKRTAANWMTKG